MELNPQGSAPKLTPEHVAAQVVAVQYHRFPGTTVTVCCITLRNGFNTIGHSACVSPENFDEQTGKDVAYKCALDKIWQLEGYLLAEWLNSKRGKDYRASQLVAHGHANYAAAPAPETPFPLGGAAGDPFADAEDRNARTDYGAVAEKFESGGGGDYAGGGASGDYASERAVSSGPLEDNSGPVAGSTSDFSSGSCSIDSGSSGSFE